MTVQAYVWQTDSSMPRDTSGSILSPFLAAPFISQIFVCSLKQGDFLCTIFLQLILLHATMSQKGTSNLHRKILTQFLRSIFCLMPWAGSNKQEIIRKSVVPTVLCNPLNEFDVGVCDDRIHFSKTFLPGAWFIQLLPRIDLKQRWWKCSNSFRFLRFTTDDLHISTHVFNASKWGPFTVHLASIRSFSSKDAFLVSAYF